MNREPAGPPTWAGVGARGRGDTGGLPVVVVAGRPNVGKSTLVNRIVGRRAAIVEERPGVTRDRLELETSWTGRDFVVIDTGGVVTRGGALDMLVSGPARRAIDQADVVLLVVDATTGITAEDDDVAELVRKTGPRRARRRQQGRLRRPGGGGVGSSRA